MEALIARAIQILVALGGAYLLTLWFALIIWTFQDIQARSRSVVAQIFSTLTVVLFFIPGVLVYMILRPRDTLDDAFQRSLEEEYLMQDLEELPLCPACQQYVEEDWVFCPSCRTELRDHCVTCDQLIDLRWTICPFCGAEQYPEEGYEELEPEPVRPAVGAGLNDFMSRTRQQISGARPPALENGTRSRPIEQATVRIDFRNGEVVSDEPIQRTRQPRPFATLDGIRQVTLDNGGNGRSERDHVLADEFDLHQPDGLARSDMPSEEPAIAGESNEESVTPSDGRGRKRRKT
jgi:RNA polymerase subunit RPABC4/transcription elongation factor Spt4